MLLWKSIIIRMEETMGNYWKPQGWWSLISGICLVIICVFSLTWITMNVEEGNKHIQENKRMYSDACLKQNGVAETNRPAWECKRV